MKTKPKSQSTIRALAALLCASVVSLPAATSTQNGAYGDTDSWGGTLPTTSENVTVSHNLTLDDSYTYNMGATNLLAVGGNLLVTNGSLYAGNELQIATSAAQRASVVIGGGSGNALLKIGRIRLAYAANSFGELILQNGGILDTTYNVVSQIDIAAGSGSRGIFTIDGGTWTNNVNYSSNGQNLSNWFNIGLGANSNGTFNVTGGSQVSVLALSIAYGSGSTGYLNINGGNIISSRAVTLADPIAGTNKQGIVSVENGSLEILGTYQLYIGSSDSNRVSSMTLNNGGIVKANALIVIGHNGSNGAGGNGSLVINAGGNFIGGASSTMIIANAAGAKGSVLVNGGDLKVGSLNLVNSTLTAGNDSVETYANFTMTSGTVNQTVLTNQYVGNSTIANSIAYFNVLGGTLNLAGSLVVGTNDVNVDNGGKAYLRFAGSSVTNVGNSTSGRAFVLNYQAAGGIAEATLADSAVINTTSFRMRGKSKLTFEVANENFAARLNLINPSHTNAVTVQITDQAQIVIDLSTFSADTSGHFEKVLIYHLNDDRDASTKTSVFLGENLNPESALDQALRGISNLYCAWETDGTWTCTEGGNAGATGSLYNLVLSFDYTPTVVPEPAQTALLLGFLGFLALRRKTLR
jgi:hypothetical protein